MLIALVFTPVSSLFTYYSRFRFPVDHAPDRSQTERETTPLAGGCRFGPPHLTPHRAGAGRDMGREASEAMMCTTARPASVFTSARQPAQSHSSSSQVGLRLALEVRSTGGGGGRGGACGAPSQLR